jgi:hypothetical protein
MSTFQTLISILLLIYVLSVIVQALQEIIKAIFRTKASVMRDIINKFMGHHLTLSQVEGALSERGLKIQNLASFDKEAFRQLLNGIAFESDQLDGLLKNAQATAEEVKNHIAASYEAARAAFQSTYARKNKLLVVVTSCIVVLVLNANIIFLYDQISIDSVVQQTLVGQAQKIELPTSQQGDLKEVYKITRQQISDTLEQYPILLRAAKYQADFAQPWKTIFGLLVMGALVSLGAPFWNDVLKSVSQMKKGVGTGL